jgi:fructokinase
MTDKAGFPGFRIDRSWRAMPERYPDESTVMMTTSAEQARPVIFGEVLFDHFPDGQRVLGGAPFNVAWHLQGFGLKPLLISRIGKDDSGTALLARMEQWGMDLRGLQIDDLHPTGKVEVRMREGGHDFDILPDQAYDYIQSEPALQLLEGNGHGLLYMGSLVSRGAVSRASLDSLLRKLRLPIFVDINLRPPWWNLARVEAMLARARWAKLNDDELRELVGRPLQNDEERQAQAEILRTRFDLELVILTLGARGADFFSAGSRLHGEPVPVETLVDTVGAGDAFSAVTLLGVTHGWPQDLILARSLAFASRVCAQRGATAADADLYRNLRREWDV